MLPKRKTEDINDLVKEFDNANEEIKEAIEEDPIKELTEEYKDDTNKRRSELIRLSEDGEIDQSVKYIKKVSAKIVGELYREYEKRRMQKANEFLTDLDISMFSGLIGGLAAAENPKEMEEDLTKDKQLKRDVENIISSITPYLPHIGLLSGGVTIGKHV